jgi:hypothetical protein
MGDFHLLFFASFLAHSKSGELKRALGSDKMEIARMRLKLRNGHAC